MRNILIIFIILALFPVCVFSSGDPESDLDVLTSFELEELINNSSEEYILIDVRTAEEYADGYIPTALNIPYDVIGDNLPTDNKDAKIIVYCRSGRRSGIAKETLDSLGYSNVINFGGVSDWEGELVGGLVLNVN